MIFAYFAKFPTDCTRWGSRSFRGPKLGHCVTTLFLIRMDAFLIRMDAFLLRMDDFFNPYGRFSLSVWTLFDAYGRFCKIVWDKRAERS